MQVTAARALLHRDVSAWRCQPAPAANEVLWGNIG